MKTVLNKVYRVFFITLCMLCLMLIFNVNSVVHASDGECADSTCTGEYINGFCNTCDSYQQPELVDDYYLISNPGELYWFRTQIATTNNINGKLTKNIIINEGDVAGSGGNKQAGWRLWVNDASTYKGTFDGNGFYVSGIYSEFSTFNGEHGFFAETDGATINNLVLINSYFKYTSGYFIGGLVGFAKGSLKNCYFEGTIEVDAGTQQGAYVGGLAGLSGDATFENCVSRARIIVKSANSTARVGGLVGSSYYAGGIFKNCLSDSELELQTTVQSAGAFIGSNRYYKHENTYFNSSKYTTAIGATFVEDTPSAVTTTDITNGRMCEILGIHQYKIVAGQDTHYQECMLCGGKTAEEDHNNDTPATCVSLAVCGVCGANHGEYDYTNHVSNEYDENGFTKCCGKGYESITLVTDSNYTELGLTSEYVGYYAIENAGQLFDYSYKAANDSNTYKEVKLVLTKDIDVNPGYTFNSDGTVLYNGSSVTSGWRNWERINISGWGFQGLFDGNYHTISGLYVNDETLEYVGLFGKAGYAEFYNVGIINSYFNANRYVGGLVGHISMGSRIENCYSEATVSSSYGAGGFVAAGSSMVNGTAVTIENCYFNGVIKPRGSTYMSGLYGSDNGTIVNSYFNKTKSSYGDAQYAKTEEQFKSGEVAYLLNGDQSEIIYGQTIGTESYPIFGGARVYGGYANCEAEVMSYTNDANHKLNPTMGHKWEFTADGTTITATCTQPTCSITDRTETITIGALDTSELTFTNTEKAAKVTESVSGLIPYEVVYKDSENTVLSTVPVTVGSYTATITKDSATISVTYEITKSVLESSPSVEVEYGRNHEEVAIESKVYIKGMSYEVAGTWEWISGTKTAKFVPTDTTLHNNIENIEVTIADIADDPVIELTSPVTNINPGQSVYLNLAVTNKYNNQSVDLPTVFVYTYKIGNAGSETTFNDGLLIVPSSAPIGSTIYVTVKSEAVANKYNSASDTIEISVTGTSGSVSIGDNGNWFIDGQDTGRKAEGTIVEIGTNGNWFIDGVDTGKKVDYSEDIEVINQLLTQEIERLEGLISSNDTEIENINQTIQNLNTIIKAAEAAAKTANDELQVLLEGKIKDAKDALEQSIEELDDKLDQAITDLENADKENADALAKAITDLTDLIKAAEAAAKTANDELQVLLEGKIKDAKDALEQSIEELDDKLDQAITDLENADKENADALAKAITDLTDLIKAAEAAAKTANDELQVLLEGKIKDAKDALEQSIEELDDKLDQAITNLENADKENADALAKAVTDLTELIEATRTALQAANRVLRADLEKQLDLAVETLENSISDLRSALDYTQSVLVAADKENAEALAKAIVDLTALIDAAKQAAIVSDEALKLELEEAEKELSEGIASLRGALKQAEEQAAKDNKELEEKLSNADASNKEELLGEIKSAIILPTVIGVISLVGNMALLVYILIKRRK